VSFITSQSRFNDAIENFHKAFSWRNNLYGYAYWKARATDLAALAGREPILQEPDTELTYDYEMLAEDLNYGMHWADTPQGNRYWREVKRRIEDSSSDTVASSDWREREQLRIDRGIYDPIKFQGLEPITEHYLHRALENEALVAYTPSDEYGQRDRQVSCKPGAYLKKFYPSLSATEVQNLATSIDMRLLNFAVTADEIERVYRNGPSSCMAYSASNFETEGVHPVRAYAGPDLQVAYLGPIAKPIARCLVWPEQKRRSTIYGDYHRMKSALEKAGYNNTDLTGARMSILRRKDNLLICPYIDGVGGVKLSYDKQHLIISDGYGCIGAANTSGYTSGVICSITGDLAPAHCKVGSKYLSHIEYNETLKERSSIAA
jgi:hypothetical protein